MEELFDDLAKGASGGLSRRQVFRRFGLGLAMAAFASLRVAASNDCGKLCAECCNNLDFPPRGPEHGQCLSDCHNGLGPCGPIVCPDGAS